MSAAAAAAAAGGDGGHGDEGADRDDSAAPRPITRQSISDMRDHQSSCLLTYTHEYVMTTTRSFCDSS